MSRRIAFDQLPAIFDKGRVVVDIAGG